MIVKLNQNADMLTNFGEFQSLFSEFKMTSFKQTLTPFYKDNVSFSERSGSQDQAAIPNFEIIEIPVSTSVNQPKLESQSAHDIQVFLDQTQRKGKRLMPSSVQRYWTTKPKVSVSATSADKDATTFNTKMASPPWLPTSSTAVPAGAALGSSVKHYGKQLIIRRVDGAAMTGTTSGSTQTGQMGFRMDSQVFLKMRKVQ
jgi:hypothetical protein